MNEIVPHEDYVSPPAKYTYPLQRSLTPSEHEMMVYQTMSKSAVDSKMYKGIGDQAGVMMIMLSARELGIPPMQALNGGLNIIQGKVEISARMMNALIRKAGHQIHVQQSTDTECLIYGKRGDTGEEQTTSFSLAEAQKAGLIKPGGGWVKWPKDMCFARALSRLARQLFSDVIGIGYVEGEISQVVEKKPSEIISIPQTISKEETVDTQEDESEYINKYLNLFNKENQIYAMQYLRAAMAHFEWTSIQTIKEFLKDEVRTLEKFNSWHTKQISEEK